MRKLFFLLMIGSSISMAPNATLGQNAEAKDPPKVKVEILNQDGESVQPKVYKVETKLQEPLKGVIRVESKDGKLTLIDGNGDQQELEVDNARSIIVDRSIQSTNKNGQKGTKVIGKAIIVGSDGTRREIDLDSVGELNVQMPDIDLFVPKNGGVFQFSSNDNRFMIGVSCEPIGKAMASQLQLTSGAGLVVVDLDDSSAAAKAGVKQHDILMYAGQNELKSLEDLVNAVQKSGQDKQALQLTLIRGGKEQSVEVMPVERPKGGGVFTFDVDKVQNMKVIPNLNRNMDLRFRDFGPGVIVRGEKLDPDALREKFRAQMEDVRRQMDELKRQMDSEFGDDK